jgi:hypothetical protein
LTSEPTEVETDWLEADRVRDGTKVPPTLVRTDPVWTTEVVGESDPPEPDKLAPEIPNDTDGVAVPADATAASPVTARVASPPVVTLPPAPVAD